MRIWAQIDMSCNIERELLKIFIAAPKSSVIHCRLRVSVFLRKRLRTLTGNRCKVRAHESVAKPISHNGHGQSAWYIGGTAVMPTRHNGKHYKSNGNNRMKQMYPNTPNSQQHNSLKYNKTENPRVGGSIPPLGTIHQKSIVLGWRSGTSA